jgi:NET1-associated nuclear protein 1 (U3 small nucleolar RNA-associated protein 17)
LNIYSTASSSLIRTLEIESLIVQGQLSKVDPEVVYVATHDCSIDIWNWTSGQKLQSLRLKSAIYWLEVVSEDDENEQLFLVLENGDETNMQFTLVSLDVSSREEPFVPFVVRLHSANEPLQFLSVACGTRVIFVASAMKFFIGVRSGKEPKSYDWNAFDFRAQVTSLDVRVEKRKSKRKEKGHQPDLIRLAVGSRQGSIFVYEDILSLLQQSSELSKSQLHWHREAVLSVKWSLDGVYDS